MKPRNFCQTCPTYLEGPYRKDSCGAHPCRAIDRAWEPRIPSPCSLKAITHATGSKIGSSRSRWNRSTEYYPVGMKTHIETLTCFFENIIVLTILKWAPTFSSIYYEQVALLHTPNRLASDETDEFLPKHVPHVSKDHIGKIHLANIPVGRLTGPESPEYLPRAV